VEKQTLSARLPREISNKGGGDGKKGDERVAELEKTVADLTEKLNKVVIINKRNQQHGESNW